MLKNVEEDLTKVTKRRVTLLEESVMNIREMLCRSDPCLHPKCTTCQVGWGKPGTCRSRSMVYENICLPCRSMKKTTRYIREMCRTLYDIGKEHQSDALTLIKNSHWREHASEHQDFEVPLTEMFSMQPIKNYRSVLARHLREAIEIGRNPTGSVLLNSKEEFSRCLAPGILVGGTWRDNKP